MTDGRPGALPPLISSRHNSQLHLVAESRRHPPPAGELFVVEGETLLGEAIRSGHAVLVLFVLDGPAASRFSGQAPEVFRVTAPVMEKISGLKSVSPVLALCRCQSSWQDRPGTRFPWLVLDGVQDPGNIGSIFRAAEAFAVPSLVLLPPAPSGLAEKVIRASAGSSLRVPHWRPPGQKELAEEIRWRGVEVMALHPRGEEPLERLRLRRPAVVLVGNEGHGISEPLQSLVTRRIRIPMEAPVESLNAAVSAALVLYHLRCHPAGYSKSGGVKVTTE